MLVNLTRRLGASLALPAALAGAIVVSGLDTSTTGPATATRGLGHILRVDANTVTGNIVANFNSGTGSGTANIYDSVISQIRARVSAGTLRDGILRERAANANDYFAVHFQAGVGTPQVSVVFNAANLYVVGYYNHATNVYVRMGAGPTNPVGAATVRDNFLRGGDYNYLESAQVGAFNRADQAMGPGALASAIQTLADGRPLGSVPATQLQAQARAITLIIQMFAEGARFDFVSANIGQYMRDGNVFTAGTGIQVRGDGGPAGQLAPTSSVTAVDWENVWTQLSRHARSVLSTGGSVRFQVGRFLVLTTMQAIANQLAVAYSG